MAALFLGLLLATYALYPRYEIFFDTGKGLTVTISTPRLVLRSAGHQDVDNLIPLFKDPEIMWSLSDVEAFSPQMIDHILYKRWIHKWAHHVPYSGFVAYEKDSQDFIGFIRLERTSLNTKPGQVEVAYAVRKPFWGKGYGTEMVKAILHHYVPYLQREGYGKVEGDPLCEVIATVQEKNPASRRVLEKNGFKINDKVLNKLKLIYPIKPLEE
jgi:RimJ/RimL family protein N-acetyltransferase